MTNPSGSGPDPQVPQNSPVDDAAPGPPAGTGPSDADPVTEVIDFGAGPQSAGTGPGTGPDGEERRYTAPGFDAGSTQIIDRVPDPPTEFIATPAHTGDPAGDAARTRTGPQQIPPVRGPRPRWLRPVIVLTAVLLLVAVAMSLMLWQRSTAKASRANMVRDTIETFDSAVRDGDLSTLRTITCGQTRQAYADYDQQAWSDTFAKVSQAKQYPVVASIDEVVVNGDRAEANVTSYMAYDPATTAVRSFDLEFRDDRWKICQAS